MYAILSSLKSILKSGETTTDDWIFKLHYKLTFLMELAFSVIITTNQFFGDPINCITHDNIPEKVVNNFCWIHSTFTLPGVQNDPSSGWDIPFYGIQRYSPSTPRVYHAYYQWVCFFLFLQGITFYVPRYFWKTKEGGKMNKLVSGLSSPILGSDEDIKEECNRDSEKTPLQGGYGLRNKRIHCLSKYLYDSMGRHGIYAYVYFACEMLNLVNVIGQMFLTNAFLGGEFTTYGTEVLRFSMTDQMNRTDPMIKVFPRVTKCTFHRYGPSGDVQRHDALCILPVNIINEKIFIFLWFWFVLLAIISGLHLLLRIPIMVFNRLRWKLLAVNTTEETKSALVDIGRTTSNLSDWLVIRLLRKNLNPMNFQALMVKLDELESKSV